MRRLLHIAAKDVLIWVRDISALAILLGMPVVLIVILGSALGGQAGSEANIPVVVVDLDRPAPSPAGDGKTDGERLVEALTGSKRMRGLFDVTESDDAGAARRRVADGDYAALLVIPEEFSTSLAAGEPTGLEVVGDPGQELSSDIFASVVRSFAARYSSASVSVKTVMAATAQSDPALLGDPTAVASLQRAAIGRATAAGALESVSVREAHVKGASEFDPLDYYALAMTAMFLMFGAMFGAFSLIKERREQTLPRLLATPASGMSVTGGKMLGIFLLGIAQFAVLYLFTTFVLGVDWGGDVAAVFAIAAGELIAVTGLAMVIGSLAKTERGAGGIGPLVIQIQALFGGSFFPVGILPEWMRPIRFVSVSGWALEGWETVRLEGGGLVDVLVPIAAMCGFALLFFALSAALMGRRR